MFITLEGPEGGGKTTQLVALAQRLRQSGYPVLATREPGGTPIGDEIRQVLMAMKNAAMQPRTEILLFQASRAQLVAEVIRPALAAGQVVLCDRYADSTVAYQGYGYQQFSPAELRPIIEFATGGLKPDLTILLDLDVVAGLQRRAQDGGWNRLDGQQVEFHQRVRQGYLEMARAEPQRWVIVDAGQPAGQVQADILRVVLSRLGNAHGEPGVSKSLPTSESR
jgi:dTMP kinase